VRLNTTDRPDQWGWRGGPEKIDIILQSINTGLNNAFDVYMAQGGAGAWAASDASGRHGTCAHMWGSLPGFDVAQCKADCKEARLGDGVHRISHSDADYDRCLMLCDRARCPAADGTRESCARGCAKAPTKDPLCAARCRVSCAAAGHAPRSTWADEFDNFWAKNLQDTPLCDDIPADDA
jgi:hypothetical protein